MPSTVVQMTAGTMTIVAEKLNAKIKPTAIFVDNVNGAAIADLVFNDAFLPSATNGNPTPTPIAPIPRLQINVNVGDCHSTEDFIKNIEFIGLVQVVVNGNVADAGCYITFIYEFL